MARSSSRRARLSRRFNVAKKRYAWWTIDAYGSLSVSSPTEHESFRLDLLTLADWVSNEQLQETTRLVRTVGQIAVYPWCNSEGAPEGIQSSIVQCCSFGWALRHVDVGDAPILNTDSLVFDPDVYLREDTLRMGVVGTSIARTFIEADTINGTPPFATQNSIECRDVVFNVKGRRKLTMDSMMVFDTNIQMMTTPVSSAFGDQEDSVFGVAFHGVIRMLLQFG